MSEISGKLPGKKVITEYRIEIYEDRSIDRQIDRHRWTDRLRRKTLNWHSLY